MRRIYKVALISGVVALVGCGGGGDDDETIVVVENNAPVAMDDTATVASGATTTIDVLENDTDEDNDALTINTVGDATNGTVAVSDDGVSVEYTPADGFLGEDSFTYSISDGEDTAEATVTVNVQHGMTVSGRVVDSPIADAVVTVTVDDQTFTATADDDGNYSLPIWYTDGSNLLVLNAQGAAENDQEHVTLVSRMASLATLQAAAGDDNILERSEASGTNITNVTTASAVLAIAALEGEEPTSEAELATAQEAIPPATLLELAAVIKLIVDDPAYSLPSGSSDVLTFANDLAAYEAFVDEVETANPELLDETVAAIIADPELMAVTDAEPASVYIEVAATRPGFIARGSRSFSFDSNGTGRVYNDDFTEDATNYAMTWDNDASGAYKMAFAEPLRVMAYPIVDDLTDDPEILLAYFERGNPIVIATREVSDISFKVLVSGGRTDMVQIIETFTESYEPIIVNGVTYQIPSQELEESYQTIVLNTDKVEPPNVDTADVVGTWALSILSETPFPSSSETRILYDDAINFRSDGSFSGTLSQLTGEWQLNDANALVLTYGDVTQTVNVIQQEGLLYGAYSVAETNAGSVASNYNRMVKRDSEFNFTTENLLTDANEAWMSYAAQPTSLIRQQDGVETYTGGYFGWQFMDVSNGFNIILQCEDNSVSSCPDGELPQYLRATELAWDIVSDSEQSFAEIIQDPCTTAGQTSCPTSRAWLPLSAEDSDVRYILEYETINYDNELEMRIIPRLNIIEKQTLPADIENPAYPGL